MNRTIVVSIGAACLLVACGSARDSSVDDLRTEKHGRANPPMYLALGDSIAMGFDPFVEAHTAQAYVGYPEYLQERIDIPHTNAACYGETTSSFLRADAPDRGCRTLKLEGLVRAGYTGTQLEFMSQFLQDHSRVELVTLALGANDMLMMLENCVYDTECILNALSGMFETMATNLVTIFGTIRGLGYTGQIVVPLYYDAFPTLSPGWSQLLEANNAMLTDIATAFGAQVVRVDSVFATASESAGGDPCAAGLLIPLTGWNEWVTTVPGASCDGHASPTGAQLIADTIATVVPPRAE